MPAAPKIHNLTTKPCYLNQRVVRPTLYYFPYIYNLQIPDILFNLAFDVKKKTDFAPLLHRQKGDEVETQHLEGILAPKHHVVSCCDLIYLRHLTFITR